MKAYTALLNPSAIGLGNNARKPAFREVRMDYAKPVQRSWPEAGGTEFEIMTFLGHRSPDDLEARKYVKLLQQTGKVDGRQCEHGKAI